MQIDHRCNMAMTTQNWCVEIEEDNAWANEIGIDMHYPRYLVEPDEFREAFKSQMLGILVAACAEQEHGTDVTNFYSTASQILGEPLTEESVRRIFGCHSLATFWEEQFPGCVLNKGSRFQLIALPGNETDFMEDMERLRAECVKKDKEKKEIHIVEAAQPENVQKRMESFNRLYVLLQGINESKKVSINTPVKHSEIANTLKTEFGIILNKEYIKENYGRSKFKLVFQDNSQTIFPQRLEYIEDPTKGGIFSIAIKPGAERLTEEEIAEAVEKAKRNEEAVTAPKKTFQPRENRQYQPQSKKASEERIQLSDADRALFQDKPTSTSTFNTTSQVNRKNSAATTESNPPRNMYLAPKGETNKAQQRQEGQNYTSEEESSGDEQGCSRHSKQKQPPQTKPSRTRGPAQDDDRLPVEEDEFDVGYSKMNDDYAELPSLDQPSYNQQVQQESQYQNQPHITPQNHARNIDDYFDGTAQQMMFDNPAQFDQPVQNVRDSARHFAPIQNPNDSHGSQRRSHGPHQGVPAQNQSTYNQSPRVANVPTDLVSSNSPYGYGELPFVQGNYSPEQRYQGNNIAQPTSMAARPASQGASRRVPQRGDSSAPGPLSVSNHDIIIINHRRRIGAFQQVMSKRAAEAQTPYEMIADYQLNLSGPRDKRDVMIEAIISMVQLHDQNNQDLRLSNLGTKLSAFCGVEVSPKDFCRENWAELQPFRGSDFHVFFIKDG
ncbi:unnamed protein product, partial [Mesorhabditis belari]|uniref:Uncharacterized protein n=1 Tax=Mesorhabditis belari TaxID=2138241 RepID=A0AAF3EJ32_9BILA